MKTHIYVAADSGLVHTVRSTSENVRDAVKGKSMLYEENPYAVGDARYHSVAKRPDTKADVTRRVAMRPGKRSVR